MAFIDTFRIVINVARIAISDSKALRMLPVSKLLRLGQHQIAAKKIFDRAIVCEKNPESYEILFLGSKIVFAHIWQNRRRQIYWSLFFSFDKKVKKNSQERKESLKSFFFSNSFFNFKPGTDSMQLFQVWDPFVIIDNELINCSWCIFKNIFVCWA